MVDVWPCRTCDATTLSIQPIKRGWTISKTSSITKVETTVHPAVFPSDGPFEDWRWRKERFNGFLFRYVSAERLNDFWIGHVVLLAAFSDRFLSWRCYSTQAGLVKVLSIYLPCGPPGPMVECFIESSFFFGILERSEGGLLRAFEIGQTTPFFLFFYVYLQSIIERRHVEPGGGKYVCL